MLRSHQPLRAPSAASAGKEVVTSARAARRPWSQLSRAFPGLDIPKPTSVIQAANEAELENNYITAVHLEQDLQALCRTRMLSRATLLLVKRSDLASSDDRDGQPCQQLLQSIGDR